MNKEEQKQHLIDLMRMDDEAGLYADTTKNLTAVEWLQSQIQITVDGYFGSPWAELFEQAKAMDKEQKLECWNVAHQAGRFEGKGIAEENWQTFEQYYNETYNK
jgi:hypothetical protein